jgi:transposase
MNGLSYFSSPVSVSQKQYEALRMYYVENRKAKEVAEKFGYSYRAFTSLITDFNARVKQDEFKDPFFVERKAGRPPKANQNEIKEIIIKLRKKNFSIEDIKISLDAMGHKIAENTIFLLLKNEGFARLPKRSKQAKRQLEKTDIKALKSSSLTFEPEEFKTSNGGLLCFLPYIKQYGIDEIIKSSSYPETKLIDRNSSIMSFLSLKLSNFRRYSSDDMWCMDRGSGLFAGLNVLPKTSWFSSYSDRVTRDMNINFLKQMHKIWLESGLLSDTINLDFTTIPYWGEDNHLENNWSGKRNKALTSMLAVLAHDPDTGIIDYGKSDVKHKNESQTVIEFLDFYRDTKHKNSPLNYIVFDSKFTNYENLRKLDDNDVKFITIRRRGKKIVDEIRNIPNKDWRTIRVEQSGNKKRTIKVYEKTIILKGYGKPIRQIYITGNGKIKPAIIITNDFGKSINEIVRKYAKRWLVEKVISEQIEFFHLNKLSSSMVIKVDFDLTMSILAHNIYRLFALDLDGYSHMTSQSIYEKFIANPAEVEIKEQEIVIKLKKKRNLPMVLENMNKFKPLKMTHLNNKQMIFEGTSYS